MKHFNLMLMTLIMGLFSFSSMAQCPGAPLALAADGSTSSAVALTAAGTATDSAWYELTVAADGYVTLSTCEFGSNVDSRMFLYSGTCGALSLVASSDDDCGKAALLDDKLLSAGVYYILLDNKSNAAAGINFNLNIDHVSVANFMSPANDDICDAATLIENASAFGNNDYATVQGSNEYELGNQLKTTWSEDFNIQNSVWYKFTAPEGGAVRLDLLPLGGWNGALAVFQGDCNDFSTLTLVAADTNKIDNPTLNLWCLTEGEEYIVLVDGFGSESGDFNLDFNTYDLKLPYIALIEVDTNFNSKGAYCPEANNFNFTGKLLQADSTALPAAIQAYIDLLEVTWSDSETGSGDLDVNSNEKAGTYTVTFEDVCGRTWTAETTVEDTVVAPFDFVAVDLKQPGCIGEPAELTYSITGGYAVTQGPNVGGYILFSKTNSNPDTTFSILNSQPAIPVGSAAFFQNGMTEGIWRIIAEDACGKIDTIDFTVRDPEFAPVVATADSIVPAYCPGTATAELYVRATGGQNTPLTYEWAYSADTSVTPLAITAFTGEDNLMASAGIYRVVVSDPCTFTNKDTVWFDTTDPTVADLDVVSTVTAPTSFGAQDGSISLAATGGNGEYRSMWWLNGQYVPQFDNMLNVSGLAQGIYVVTVNDTCLSAGDTTIVFKLFAPLANDNACDAIVISEGDSLNVFSNEGATVETGETSVVIPVDQDDAYNGWAADNQIQSSVWFKFTAPASGAVELSANVFYVLNEVDNLNFDPQLAVFDGDCNDFSSLSLIAANDNEAGNPNNDSRLEVFCLEAGKEYLVLVDGYVGIGQEGYFGLTLNNIDVDVLAYTHTKTNITCLNTLGSINITNITGGVYLETPEEYFYTVDFNGTGTATVEVDGLGNPTVVTGDFTDLNFTDLVAGTYTVTITDVCGNSATKDIEVVDFQFSPFVINIETVSPTCPGGNDGEINLSFEGGATPGVYDLIADGNPAVSVVNSEFTLIEEDGTYSFTLIDGCGNEKDFVATITDPVLAPVTYTLTEVDPTCPLAGDGSITIDIEGGSGIFDLGIDDDNNLSATDVFNQDVFPYTFTGLSADEYWIIVEDICNAPDTAIFDSIVVADPILTPIVITATTVNPSTDGAADGSFSFVITGGFPPYDVEVTDLATLNTLTFTNNEVTGLKAGTYRVDVADDCGATGGVGVEFVDLFNPPTNNNVCDAQVLTVNGGIVFSNNAAATVEAGEDAITPQDGDCLAQDGWCNNDGIDGSVWFTFDVPASGAVNIAVNSFDFDAQVAVYSTTDCNDFGTFTLVGANDDAGASDENASLNIACLTPGKTLVVLVDANVTADAVNTSGDFTIEVTETSTTALQVLGNVTFPSDENTPDGEINTLIIGGTAPYTIQWTDNGVVSAVITEDRTGLGLGTYTITVTDACGATASKTWVFDEFESVSNDNVCDAIMIPVDGMNYDGFTNEGATLETGELALEPETDGDCFANDEKKWCTNDGLHGTIWFKFVAPASGNANVSLCNDGNNTFDTQLAVFEATFCNDFGTFNLLAANDDYTQCALGSYVELTGLTACATYYVMVDADDDQRGEMGISITDPSNTYDAGDDASATVCNTETTYDLATLVTGDMGGIFTDVDATGALTGSVLDVTALAVGDYTFTYTVGQMCAGEYVVSSEVTLNIAIVNCVGINEITDADVNVYPNPTNGIFVIEGITAGTKVSVKDLAGKVVYANTANSVETKVSLNGYAKGVYAITLSDEAGNTVRRKVVLQ